MAIEQAPPATATNADLVRWVFERLNAHDIDACRQLLDESTVHRFPDRTCVGPEQIGRYFDELFAAVPDLRMEVEAIVAERDDVFVHWRMTGTHRGSIQGVAGTDRPFAVDGMDHFIVREGRVVSNFVVSDRMQFAQQVGMLPPDGSPVDRGVKRLFNARTALLARLRR